ncbi:cystinosin homolog [Humulus lupulus]|uniref:cystinosin homolog n=1 Tax=Humulus lupulus TaxID=3486 RepID=UPI002B4057AC|nr:cystinosin homolog [Humulus lupulus]
MASWNTIPMEITYEALGWIAFLSWSISFYPQVILNFRRKSVVGLNFDFMVLNVTKHTSYLIYNATLYFSSTVQRQYFEKYGFGQMIPVAANDVAFSVHVTLLTIYLLFQISIYEKGDQTISKITILIIAAVWLFAGVCFFIALQTNSWLWLISIFNMIQVFMTTIKYTPQVFMNFKRKSTEGFSIGYILCDFSGGLANYAQMTVQSLDQNSWINFSGNMGKVLLSLISMFFDVIFMCQHFLLYSTRKVKLHSETSIGKEPLLIKSCDYPELENV